MFFVDRDTFQEIMERICPFVANRDEQKAINSSGAAIPLRTMVAMTLRWLASTSYLDLCFAWGTSSSTFYHPVQRFITQEELYGLHWRPLM
jgi:hypothetical protein